MQWIAPSEKDADNAALEKCLWDAANQLWAGLKQSEYSEPVLGLIFLRFAEVRFSAQRKKLEGDAPSAPKLFRRASRVDEPAAYHADGILYRHSDLRADTATRVSAKSRPRSHSAGLLRSERQLLANPPFNDSDTALRGSAFFQREANPQVVSEAKDNFRKDDDVRWQWSGATWTTRQGCPEGERGGVHQFGVPPKGNANFAWVQHFIHHLAPQGMAAFVLANGSMSSNQSGDCHARSARREWGTNSQGLGSQRDIRRALIEADLVDTALRDSAFPQSEATPQVLSAAKNNMVALPGQLFYSTQIPVCLWFLAKNKAADAKRGFRDRRKQTLFIDARKLGTFPTQVDQHEYQHRLAA